MENKIEKKMSFSDSMDIYLMMLFAVGGGTMMAGLLGISIAKTNVVMAILAPVLVIHGIFAGEFSGKIITLLMPTLISVGAGVIVFFTMGGVAAAFICTLVLAFVLMNKQIYRFTRD